MSEVGDACQIVMISGRMIAATADLSVKTALLMMKIYNSLYLGKWKGKVSFQRFRAIKGDEFEFINILLIFFDSVSIREQLIGLLPITSFINDSNETIE